MKKLTFLLILLPVVVFSQEWHMRQIAGQYGVRYETRTETIASIVYMEQDYWMFTKNPGLVSDKKTIAALEIDGDDYGTLALRVLPGGCKLFLPHNIVRALLRGNKARIINRRVGLDLELDLDGLSKAWRKAF